MLQKKELVMDSIKFFIAVLLLVFSSQSLAMFMPADYKTTYTDKTVVPGDGGC
jgi:hypothetical protein